MENELEKRLKSISADIGNIYIMGANEGMQRACVTIKDAIEDAGGSNISGWMMYSIIEQVHELCTKETVQKRDA